MQYEHVSVMPEEIGACLNCQPGDVAVDGTLGGCGHALETCRRIGPQGLLIGIDQDPAAIANAEKTLAPYRSFVHLFQGNFVQLPEYLSQLNIQSVNALLIDLGLSLYQLKQSGRGFSFNADEPLDMRMDPERGKTAHQLVNQLPENELARVFTSYGEERFARRIARAIVNTRHKLGPIANSRQLAEIVRRAVPAKARQDRRIHPATRVFMALRIAVNHELERLEQFLALAPGLLASGGRFCAIAFHSLEDRIVKKALAAGARGCICPPRLPQCQCNRKPSFKLPFRKPLRPQAAELQANPMARSARLRMAIKL
jgi:16S rRNA (cytosine1402-N4)-methyltransferase